MLDGIKVAMIVYNSLERDPRVWKEARSLAAAGAEVHVYALRVGAQQSRSTGDGFLVMRFSESSPKSRRPGVLLRGLKDLRRATGGNSYDLVHCHDASTLYAGTKLAGRCRAPLIYDAHEYFPDHRPVSSRSGGRGLLEKAIDVNRRSERGFIKKAAAVVTVSDGIAHALQRHHRLEERPVVLTNSVPYWEPEGEGESLPELLHIPKGEHLVVFHGGLTPARGVENCLAAVSGLTSAHLVALGPVTPSYAAHLRDVATERGMASRFHMPGPVPYSRLLQLLSSADASLYLPALSGVTTSYRLSLPNKVFEAVMARLPLVVSDLPEIGRLVEGYGIGLTVDPAAPEAVAAELGRVLDAPLRRSLEQRLESAARELAWEREEGKLLSLYLKLLNPREARARARH